MRTTLKVVGKQSTWWAAICGALLSQGAMGAPANPPLPGPASPLPPRVLVIFDNSRSMSLAPDYLAKPWTTELYKNDDTTTDPQGNPVSDAVCRSKFCIAKKTVHDVLQSYVQTEVKLSLATYYQYLVKYMPSSGIKTRCWYDAMWKPGQALTLPANGNFAYDDGNKLGSGPRDLANLAVPDGTKSNQYFCGGDTTYNLTEQQVVGGWTDCWLYNYKSNPGATVTPGAGPLPGSCKPNAPHTLYSYDNYENKGGVYYRRQVAYGSSCPATVPQSVDYSSATSLTVKPGTNDAACGSSSDLNCWNAATAPFDCTAGAPCEMYSASSIGDKIDSKTQWVGTFGGDCSATQTGTAPTGPAPTDSSSTLGVCAKPLGSIGALFYGGHRTDQSVNIATYSSSTNTNNCNGLPLGVEKRISDGSMSATLGANAIGSAVAMVTAAGGVVAGYGSNWGIPATSCSADWPCDVTLTSKATNPVVWSSPLTLNYCPTSPPSDYLVDCQPASSKPISRLKSEASCPVYGVESSTPAGLWDQSLFCNAPSFSGGPCTLNTAAVSETAGTIPSCPATKTTWTATAPGSCTMYTISRPYSLSSTNAYDVYVDVAGDTVACNATAANASFSGSNGTAQSKLTDCLGAASCQVVAVGGPGASPNTEFFTSTTSTTPPDATWTPFNENNLGGVFYVDIPGPGGCGSNGQIAVIGSVLGRLEAGTGIGGSTYVGEMDSSPLYQCKYAKIEKVWSRQKKRCSYQIQERQWAVDNAITWCNYDLEQKTSKTAIQTYTCSYDLKVRSFLFDEPSHTQCKYFRARTWLRTQHKTYRYEYLTKGGELMGSYATYANGGHFCGSGADYNEFKTQCPPVLDECKGAGTTCYLRNSLDEPAPAYSELVNVNTRADGRYANVSGGAYFNNINYTSGHLGAVGKACLLTDYATPPTTEPSRAAYCVEDNGVPPLPKYKLVSGYPEGCSDPADPSTCATNDIAAISSDARVSALSLKPGVGVNITESMASIAWNNAPTKAYGLSTAGPTFSDPGQMLMSFPADTDTSGGYATFKQMLSTCERPDSTNVNWPNWSGARGICMPDTGSAAPGYMGGDFTPLYGSLSNALEYLKHEIDNDANYLCRKYFVILATDGLENTPANRTQVELNSAVAALRTLTSANSRHKDVQTFVLGFGDATADPTAKASLDAMSVEGGTGSAYLATQGTDLQTKLNQVFASILAGTYSRSKPVLSTNGKTIYAAYFDRAHSNPEWTGHFTAYDVMPAGTLQVRWELGAPSSDGVAAGLQSKIDNGQTDSDRSLYTDVLGSKVNFASSVSLDPLLTSASSYPATLNAGSVVDFVRNASKAEEFLSATAPAPKRLSRLNAIVSSVPVAFNRSMNPVVWGGGAASYSTFQGSTTNRESRILVGASDGILRAIRDDVVSTDCSVSPGALNCDDGKEAWGWVPSALHPVLWETMTGYRPGVDGQTALEDVCAQGSGTIDAKTCTVSEWKTVAIGSMKGGGRGIVALDVTVPSSPSYLWSFSKAEGGDDLGYVQAPIIGRVDLSGKDRFIAILAGGSRDRGIYGPLSQANGDEVYVFDAVRGPTAGVPLELFDADLAGSSHLGMHDRDGKDNQFEARPSYFRRSESAYMDNAMLAGTAGVLYTMRFREPAHIDGSGAIVSDSRPDSEDWVPQVFFDPTKPATSKNPLGHAVRVRRVIETPNGTGGYVYSQSHCESLPGGTDTCGTLPFAADRRLPFYLRPRLATVYDPYELSADYFIGTGNLHNPTIPGNDFKWNYFYAIHDGAHANDGNHDGEPLWVNQFIKEDEQVLSEPALINGSLIVATYTPPLVGAVCDANGDTTFYCFDPRTGELRNCLVDASTGASVSVLRYANVGIPSDPVVIGSNMYWMSSNTSGTGDDKPKMTTVLPASTVGNVRSYRRIR